MLELIFILFIINTQIVIKEIFLNIMIMFIMYKMGEVNKLTLKIELIIFRMTLSISKNLMPDC